MKISRFKLPIVLILLYVLTMSTNKVYAVNDSKATDTENPKMDWWKEARYGMFIHWGLYSMLNGEWEGKRVSFSPEWIMNILKLPVNDYKALAKQFNPVLYNADSIAQIAKDAGMKYVVITTKHHEGFALFKSVDPFNVVDATPFKRDIVAELAAACRRRGLKIGVYYSQGQDWTHPGGGIYGPTWDPIQAEQKMDEYLDRVALPQVKELLSNFNPDIIWWDTPAGITKKRAERFLEITKNYPKLIMNDRLYDGMEGDFETPECFIPDNGIPGKNWESCMTTSGNWCYSKYDTIFKTPAKIIESLCNIASKGGNYLLNVGPTPQGLVPQIAVDNLREAGHWLKKNGEAIYGTTASPFLNLKWGKATVKEINGMHKIYLHIFDWPASANLEITGLQNKILKAYPLEQPNTLLKVSTKQPTNTISLAKVKKNKFITVIVLEINDKPLVYNAPVIESESNVFSDKVVFTATSNLPNATVRYTTNNTLPTAKSPIANKLVSIDTKTEITISAQSFIGNKPVSAVAQAVYKVEQPIPSINVVNVNKGLKYKHYRGAWTKLPEFDNLTPENTGVVNEVTLVPKIQALYYGFVFEGYVYVPQTNVYRIYLTSDDGSNLTLADKFIDNDGAHGMDEKFRDMALCKGYHKLRINYFQNGGGDGLRLEWKPLGGKRSIITGEYLFH